jgi:DNA replication protein DnaC
LEKIIETYKKQVFDNFGKRISNGKCSFCGKELSNNEYCDCSEAALVNRYFIRAWKKIQKLQEYEILNADLETVRKEYILPAIITPRKFQGMKFEHYKTENESQKKALNGVIDYYKHAVKNYLTGTNLILFGNYGTGKTMLMSILCRELANGYLFQPCFVNLVDFINEIKDTFNASNNRTAKQTLDKYSKSEFLFLDDIDKIKPTEYAKETVYSLINYRTEHELPTIVSANHTPEELDSNYFDEAIVSRLADINNSKIIHFSHNNKRLGG